MRKIWNHKKIIICISIVALLGISYLLYDAVYLDIISDIDFNLIQEQKLTIPVTQSYQEKGAKANFRGIDISDKIIKKGSVDTTKIGDYVVEYEINYKHKSKSLKRMVSIVDQEAPVIQLYGLETVSIFEGTNFEDPGAVASDNYDGDITNKIVKDGSIDSSKPGIYRITYSVVDSSGNKASTTRTVEVKKKPTSSPGIAVLNYHFFYSNSERCGEGNCLNTTKFEEQLRYLKEHGYKTVTMNEFVNWMYGEIELPKKSVLLTIDDGAMGTGRQNGNKLIPLLEKYQLHATLFLITGWWNIDNYRSPYLDIESHTHDMHNENFCKGVTRGARMLCSSHDVALADLKKSIAITKSTQALCYPFYAYNASSIELAKEAGFKLAFAGGGYKATRNSNRYAVPRIAIHSNITMDTFIQYVS